ncbi:RluA family pseudouridine synthase [bacterium]|mgnify:CR=1 FL=1|jgi:23S rRNA pseudouridine1911/1915/1917 synthase|nr:RluA family pseudouridine synthase [bacterium]
MEFKYKNEEKIRLDKFLTEQLNDQTRSQIKKLILSGLVLVNEESCSVHHWLKKDDIIKINTNNETPAKKIIPKKLQPKIIEQTDDYLVIEKPTRLLVHPTEKLETDTLADWLRDNFPSIAKIGDEPMRPGIVHRLDKDVSGLMVVALNNPSFYALKKQFQDRTIKKEYLALVHGAMRESEGEINAPIERDRETGLMKVQIVKKAGKVAITTYKVERKFINYTLIKVKIKTGRTHQIRAHLYSIGHSMVGDTLYRTKDIRKKKKIIDDLRIFLHAHYLSFQDQDGIWQEYTSPLPNNLEKFLTTLK